MTFSDTNTKIGDRIRLVREQLKMSQGEFAESIGLKRPNYANIETNRQLPTIEQLTMIVHSYSSTIEILSYDWLIDGHANTVGAKKTPIASPIASPTASPTLKKYDKLFSEDTTPGLLMDEAAPYQRIQIVEIPPEEAQARYIAALERTVADKERIIELLEYRLNENESGIKET